MLSIKFSNIDPADLKQLNTLARSAGLPSVPKEVHNLERIQKYRRAQSDIWAFFRSCAAGDPDLRVLDVLYAWFCKRNSDARFLKADDQFKPVLTLDQPMLDVAECAFLEIISSFISGQGDKFRNVRECPYCGKFFIGDNSRAKFCTQSHGTLYRRQKKAERDQPLDKESLERFARAYYGNGTSTKEK